MREIRPRGSSPARSVDEAAISEDVRKTLMRWRSRGDDAGVLIGGIAYAFYARPRYTLDIDFLYPGAAFLPQIPEGFRSAGAVILVDELTNVQIDLFTPEAISLPITTAGMVFDRFEVHDRLKLASLEGMIALCLHTAVRCPKQCFIAQQNIIDMIQCDAFFQLPQMDGWGLSDTQCSILQRLYAIARA